MKNINREKMYCIDKEWLHSLRCKRSRLGNKQPKYPRADLEEAIENTDLYGVKEAVENGAVVCQVVQVSSGS